MESKSYGYCRVSSEDQAESGLGLEAQKEMIRNYIRFAQLPSCGREFIDPAVSGSTCLFKRKAGRELQANVKPGDHVLFAKLDRAFRNLDDCRATVNHWRAHGVTIHFLDLRVDTSTPAGELMLNMLAAFADFERRRCSERLKEAKAQCRRLGRPQGGWDAGYGYYWERSRSGHWVKKPIPEQLETLALIKQLVDAGMPLLKIYYRFLHEGIKYRRPRRTRNHQIRWEYKEWTISRIRSAYLAMKNQERGQ